jgi:hypothetical protein
MNHPSKLAAWSLSMAVVLAVSAALAATAVAPKHTDPGRDYSKEIGFSFVPPEGWTKESAPPAGVFVLYSAPKEPGAAAANMNVNAQPGGEGDIDQALPEMKKALATVLKDYKAVDEGKITINGRQAIYLSGKFTAGGMTIQNLQFGILGANKKVYTMTFTTLETEFAKYRPTFEKCAKTAVTD